MLLSCGAASLPSTGQGGHVQVNNTSITSSPPPSPCREVTNEEASLGNNCFGFTRQLAFPWQHANHTVDVASFPTVWKIFDTHTPMHLQMLAHNGEHTTVLQAPLGRPVMWLQQEVRTTLTNTNYTHKYIYIYIHEYKWSFNICNLSINTSL